MNITVSEIVVISAGLLTIMNLIDKILSWARQVRAPETDRIKSIEVRLIQVSQKLDDHERMLEKHAGFFDVDKHRIDVLETGNHIACKALLALLHHANGGGSYEEMQDAEKELNGFIFKRST